MRVFRGLVFAQLARHCTLRLRKPVYNGRPLSRSLYHKVPPEEAGPKYDEEKFAACSERPTMGNDPARALPANFAVLLFSGLC